MSKLKINVSTNFSKALKKIKSEELKQNAEKLYDDIVEFCEIQLSSKSVEGERAKEIILKRRIKPIRKFRDKRPKRMEATFSADGRFVWTFDSTTKTLSFMYLGGHSVIDKK